MIVLTTTTTTTTTCEAFSLTTSAPMRESIRKKKNKSTSNSDGSDTSGNRTGRFAGSASYSSINHYDGFGNTPRSRPSSSTSSSLPPLAYSNLEDDGEYGSSFEVRLERESTTCSLSYNYEDEDDYSYEEDEDDETRTLERRRFLHTLLATSAVATSSPAEAFERSFPEALEFAPSIDDPTSSSPPAIELGAIGEDRLAVRRSRSTQLRPPSPPPTLKTLLKVDPSTRLSRVGIFGSAAWGTALWLLSGSRSNPLVLPLANLLYSSDTTDTSASASSDTSTSSTTTTNLEETTNPTNSQSSLPPPSSPTSPSSTTPGWLEDRREGLFTPIPPTFSILLGLVFFALGTLTDISVLLLSQGDATLDLQLAGVTCIAGGTIELGRIASGEKMMTRAEDEREALLEMEFREFAERRLIVIADSTNSGGGGKGGSGNVHRTEVTRAFRRFYGKYRTENDEYPLVDVEIERILRRWNASRAGGGEISSAGFVKGVKLNTNGELR